MSTTYVQPGDVLEFTAPTGGVTAGTAVLIGGILVIPTATVAQTLPFRGHITGVHSHAKAASEAWAEGQIVYWDAAASVFTTVGASNDAVGVAAEAVASGVGDVIGKVRLNGAAALSGPVTVANSAVAPALLDAGTPVVIALTFADAATATYVYENEGKLEIIDAVAIKDAAGAANTIQITDIADAAITDAMAFAVDKTVTRAGTIDKAKRVLAAGAGFKVVNTRAAGSSAGQLFIYALKRA